MKWCGAIRKADFRHKRISAEPIPAFTFSKTLSQMIEEKSITTEESKHLHESMATQRFFELMFVYLKNAKIEGIHDDVRNYLEPDELKGIRYLGATHLCVGQEAVAAPFMLVLKKGDVITSHHRGHGHSIGIGLDLDAMMSEMFGKYDGCCKGVGGSMHITGRGRTGIRSLGANGVVGGGYPIAVGAGISMKLLKQGIVFAIAGDGSMNTGSFHESLNMAAQLDAPVAFLFENNGAGMTGRVDEVTGFKNEGTDIGHLIRRAWGYFPNSVVKEGRVEVVNGMDVLAVYEVYKKLAKLLHEGKGPTFTLIELIRYTGHSLSDDTLSYRTPEETCAWKDCDAILNYEKQLIDAKVMTETEIADKRKEIGRKIIDAVKRAQTKQNPPVTALLDNVFADKRDEDLNSIKMLTDVKISGATRVLSYREAIREAVAQLFSHDKRAYYWGEDVAEYGGAFGVTDGLKEKFPDRIWNSAISENAIVGAGLGSALTGLKPMTEVMYGDFLAQAQDQIANQAALNRFMYGGNRTSGFLIITTIGGGKSYACQHGKELVSQYVMPGLRIVTPSNPFDAKGLLVSALYWGDPVIYFEHQLLLEKKGEVPEELYYVPLGVANLLEEGNDVTIWSYSKMVDEAVSAAKELKRVNVTADVIDARTISPMDYETIKKSLKKTKNLVLVSQGPDTGNIVHSVASRLKREYEIQFNFETVTAPDGIIPTAENLERAYLPNQLRIIEKVCKLRGMNEKEIRETFAKLYARYER